MAEKVKISPKVVKSQIENEGMTRKQLAEFYGISVAQMTKFMEATGMSKLRARQANGFEIVIEDNDDIDTANAEIAEVVTAMNNIAEATVAEVAEAPLSWVNPEH